MTRIASSGRSTLFTASPYAAVASSGRSVLFYEGAPPAPKGAQPTAQGAQISGAQMQGQWMKPRPTQF